MPKKKDKIDAKSQNEKARKANAKMLKAAKPLIKYLCENWHPHVTAIVTPTGCEILSGELSTGPIHEFILD